MSFNAIRWAMEQKLPCTEKMVLLTLADFCNQETGQCNPQKESIALKTGLCVRAVDNVLIRLKENGIIKFDSTNGRRSNQYTLNIGHDIHNSTSQEIQGSTPQVIQGISQANPAGDSTNPAGDSTNPAGDSTNPAGDSTNPAGNAPEPVITRKEPKKRERKFTDVDLDLAEMVLQGVKRLNPSYKQPNMDAWADVICKMRVIDERTPDQIRDVFQWANADDFWRSNILSPAKLRKQFDQLLIKMGDSMNKTGPAERPPMEAFPE